MLITEDRVMEASTSTGTGNFTLAGAYTGFRTFASVCSTSDTVYYLIEAIDGDGQATGDWETGLGTYSAADTLTRTTVSRSSNANAAVNFSAGNKRVMLAPTSTYFASLGSAPLLACAQSTGLYLAPDGVTFIGTASSIGADILLFYLFSKKTTIDAIASEVTTGTGGTTLRAGIYSSHATTGMPDQLIEQATDVVYASPGVQAMTLAADYSVTEPVWLAYLLSAATTHRTISANRGAEVYGHANLQGSSNHHVRATFSFAALPADTSGLTLAVSGSTAPSVGGRVA